MSNLNLHTITNSFQDVRLVSLASWRQANEFTPRDHGGPYVVMQEGYDPADMKMIGDEFVLGRSGKWLSVGLFYKLPVAERRKEFIYGTAAEVMQIMGNLPSKPEMLGRSNEESAEAAPAPDDEMATAFHTAKTKGDTKN